MRVNIDYHIEVDGHYYSVPFTYVRQQLTVRLTDSSIECFVGSQRIAAHLRSRQRGHHTTINEHMPLRHQQYAAATPERITTQAAQTGPATASLVGAVIDQRAHPEQGYRACLGILRLGTAYGSDRLEAACQRALSIGATNYKSIESILKTGLDRQPLSQNPPREPDRPCTAIEHANIRGSAYYHIAPEDSLRTDSLRTDSPSTAIVLWSAHEQTHDGVMQQGGNNPC